MPKDRPPAGPKTKPLAGGSWRRVVLWTILLNLAVLIFRHFVNPRLLQIEAEVWHWRHGYTTYVGEYQVPVPKDWLVEPSEHPTITIGLIGAHLQTKEDPEPIANTIIIDSPGRFQRDIDSWASVRRRVLEQTGITDIQETKLQAAGETIICLGGHRGSRGGLRIPNKAFVSYECRSTGGVDLVYFGYSSELPQFYAIASQIRKQSP
jgi:hypothetical protein